MISNQIIFVSGTIQGYGDQVGREGIDDTAGTEISQRDYKPNGHASRGILPLSTGRPPVAGARSGRAEQASERQEEYGKLHAEVSPTDALPRRTQSISSSSSSSRRSSAMSNAILSRALSRQKSARALANQC